MKNTYSSESNKELAANLQSLLANERTLLAWIRTGLTIQAGGIALTAFHQKTPLPGHYCPVFRHSSRTNRLYALQGRRQEYTGWSLTAI